MTVIVRRVRQTLAVALWRVNAGHIAQFYRRALFGAQRADGGEVAVPAAAGPGGGL